MVGALVAGKSRGEQLDLSSSCWNVTSAAQSDGAVVRTPPPPTDCIYGKSAANAFYCMWALVVLVLLNCVTVVVKYNEITHLISTTDNNSLVLHLHTKMHETKIVINIYPFHVFLNGNNSKQTNSQFHASNIFGKI